MDARRANLGGRSVARSSDLDPQWRTEHQVSSSHNTLNSKLAPRADPHPVGRSVVRDSHLDSQWWASSDLRSARGLAWDTPSDYQ